MAPTGHPTSLGRRSQNEVIVITASRTGKPYSIAKSSLFVPAPLSQASPVSMAKIVQQTSCSRCMDSIVLAKGSPLARIACANCRQAVLDPHRKTKSRNGVRLKCALAALSEAQPKDLPDPNIVVRMDKGFHCPDCGRECSTAGALGSHRQTHGVIVHWPEKVPGKARKRSSAGRRVRPRTS